MLVDSSFNIYISDGDNHCIRKQSIVDGIVRVIAGTIGTSYGYAGATPTGDGGPATLATLYYPKQMVFDRYGNLYVAVEYHHNIRKISPQGIISTFFGSSTGVAGSGLTSFNFPYGLAGDSSNNIYVSDQVNFLTLLLLALERPSPPLPPLLYALYAIDSLSTSPCIALSI